MPGFTKDILGKRVSRIDLYQIFHDEDTWFFNVCVIKLKYAYSTLLLNIYKETDKQKHQYNCLSWTGCFFHKHCFFLNKQQEDKFLLFRHIYLYLADIFSYFRFYSTEPVKLELSSQLELMTPSSGISKPFVILIWH